MLRHAWPLSGRASDAALITRTGQLVRAVQDEAAAGVAGVAVLCAAGSVVLAEHDEKLRRQEGLAGYRFVHSPDTALLVAVHEAHFCWSILCALLLALNPHEHHLLIYTVFLCSQYVGQ